MNNTDAEKTLQSLVRLIMSVSIGWVAYSWLGVWEAWVLTSFLFSVLWGMNFNLHKDRK